MELTRAGGRGLGGQGVDLPHRHGRMNEIYLVARGESVAVVGGREIPLVAGSMLVVEPGEEHTFRSSSEDYLHLVVQTPFAPGDKVETG